MLRIAEKFFAEPKQKTFVELVKHHDGQATHIIKTYDKKEKPCWFLLKANERDIIKLEHTTYEDVIDLTQYGTVLASGWGHEPDQQALEKHGHA